MTILLPSFRQIGDTNSTLVAVLSVFEWLCFVFLITEPKRTQTMAEEQ